MPLGSSHANVRPWVLLLLSVVVVAGGCTAAQPARPAPTVVATPDPDVTPVPTVPPSTPVPTVDAEAEPTPIATRPVGRPEVKASPGQPIGPIVTFLGAARADGVPVEPESVDAQGVPTYLSVAGSGFMIVVEAKPGLGGHEVGRRVFVHRPDDPTLRPDLEIIVDRDLGDGSPAVCDRGRPNPGGIPGIRPLRFADTQKVADATNDLGCRFETFQESEFSCTMDAHGNYSFVNPETTNQFCGIVARTFAFPVGRTEVHVRLRDTEGNPGPIKRMRIRRPANP